MILDVRKSVPTSILSPLSSNPSFSTLDHSPRLINQWCALGLPTWPAKCQTCHGSSRSIVKSVGEWTAWNEFSSSMALAVICLATGKGFSKVDTPLFEGMLVPQQVADDVANEATNDVEDVAPTPPPSPIAQPSSPLQQQQPSPPLQSTTISMDLLNTLLETYTSLTRRVENLEQDKIAQAYEITKLKQRVRRLEKRNKVKAYGLRRLRKVGTAQKIDTSADTVMDDQEDASKQGEKIANIDADENVTLEEVAVVTKDAEDDEPESTELKEVVEVVTTAKLMTKVVTATATITTVTTAAFTITAAPSAARRRKGVVIRDLKETATPLTIVHSKPKSKDKGKGILVEEPKPLKKQAQIEQDEAYARELEAELNKNINWDDVIKQVKRKEKEDNTVLRYQALKMKPQTEAQARKNMMVYLKNMVGFKMDFFRGMSYDDIRLIFEKYFNSNVPFLEKSKEQLEEEESKALKRKTKSSEKKAVKKQKLDEEIEELKKHLEIVPNDDDDVYTEATPLALKVPVVDYEIHT
uniref:Uncharacterized protein n=1 Tax=Tanacetum cinerariifolium TaxID=118510 RepID=A0A6L2M5S7_TANCI|nr:hypothetical protein [Tanacetum cinerariifolium]